MEPWQYKSIQTKIDKFNSLTFYEKKDIWFKYYLWGLIWKAKYSSDRYNDSRMKHIPASFDDFCNLKKCISIKHCGHNWKSRNFATEFKLEFGGIFYYI